MNSKSRGRGLGIAGALLTLLAGSVQAEGLAIGGYVETQYNYNLNKPMSGENDLRSYDAQDNDIDSTAHVALTGAFGDDVTYAVEFDAGSDAAFTAGAVGESVVLQEAYVNYVSASKLGFKAGKFATYQGIEVIENVGNPTISRGFLYGLAEPFTHVGGVLTYALEKVDFAAGVVNGWDQQNDANDSKTFVGKVGFNFGDPLTFSISGYHGAEKAENEVISDDLDTPSTNETSAQVSTDGDARSSIDLTGVTKIIPNVDLWFQMNYGYEENTSGLTDDKWMGWTIQPVIKITEKFSLGARYEYFYNDEGSRTGTADLTVSNVTIAPAYKLTDNVLLRAEVRHDMANLKVFEDEDGIGEDAQTTIAFQAAVTF